MQEINVFGKKISKGHCTCMTARVMSKEFDLMLSPHFLSEKSEERFDISITEDKVIELVNKSISFQIHENDGIDNRAYLVIETENYKVYVDIPESDCNLPVIKRKKGDAK